MAIATVVSSTAKIIIKLILEGVSLEIFSIYSTVIGTVVFSSLPGIIFNLIGNKNKDKLPSTTPGNTMRMMNGFKGF